MSAATELFAPDYEPVPVRHLRAVPDGIRSFAPDPARPAGSVSVLLPPEPERLPVRLTRRGVVVLAVFVAALGTALVWVAALSSPDESGSPAPSGASAATVTVQAGETLWSIAGRVAPTADPRAEVDHLRQLNGIGDAGLVPGQQLRVR